MMRPGGHINVSDEKPWQRPPSDKGFSDPTPQSTKPEKLASFFDADTPVQTLDLRYINGDAEAITYHFIDRYIRKGQGKVILRLGQEAVVIEGRNLKPLYDALRKNSCAWIMEQRVDFVKSVPQDMAVVSNINILPADQAIE